MLLATATNNAKDFDFGSLFYQQNKLAELKPLILFVDVVQQHNNNINIQAIQQI